MGNESQPSLSPIPRGARKVGQEIRPCGSSMGKPSPSSRGQAPRCHPEGAARRICTPALLLGLLKLYCHCPDISKRKIRRPINGKVGQEIRPRGSGNICHPEHSEGSDPRTPIALLSQRDGGFDSVMGNESQPLLSPYSLWCTKSGPGDPSPWLIYGQAIPVIERASPSLSS